MVATLVPIFGPIGNVLVALLLGIAIGLVLHKHGEPLAITQTTSVQRVWLITAVVIVGLVLALAWVGGFWQPYVRPRL